MENIEQEVKENIILILSEQKNALTTDSIRRRISKNIGREVSWNTVKKYLDHMVLNQRIAMRFLPNTKDMTKPGVRIYSTKMI